MAGPDAVEARRREAAAELRVLITNVTLSPRSGTVLYVRDLAFELQRRGHTPMVFSSTAGDVAQEISAAGILVSSRLSRLPEPDVIHGHHYAPTLLAVRRFRSAPAIHVCHDHRIRQDRTPIHPRIRRHFGVSRLAVRRLIAEGVLPDEATLLPNFVDTTRLTSRSRLPLQPHRALVFSTSGHGDSLAEVRAACRDAGLELDVIGPGLGTRVGDPDSLLSEYDLVFAKGRAALSAMAVGNAVVVCDYDRFGPLVTASNFDDLRLSNFGFEAMRKRIAREPLRRQIALYDPVDATRVRDLVRARAGLTEAADRLVEIYTAVLRDTPPARTEPDSTRSLDAMRSSVFLRAYWGWAALPQPGKDRILNLPGMRRFASAVRRVG